MSERVENKTRSILKKCIKSLIMNERNIESFAAYLRGNTDIFEMDIVTKDTFPCNEIGDILHLSNEYEYDELWDTMSNLVDTENNLDDEIEKFLKKYGL